MKMKLSKKMAQTMVALAEENSNTPEYFNFLGMQHRIGRALRDNVAELPCYVLSRRQTKDIQI
jgi:hypothetical protein